MGHGTQRLVKRIEPLAVVSIVALDAVTAERFERVEFWMSVAKKNIGQMAVCYMIGHFLLSLYHFSI